MNKIVSALLMSLVFQIGYADEEMLPCEPNECGHFYAGLLGGLNFGSNCSYNYREQKTSGLGGIFAGYQFASHLRVEVEATYSRINLKSEYFGGGYYFFEKPHKIRSNIQSANLLGNILYEIPIFANIAPYFGVGCGYGWRQLHYHQVWTSYKHTRNKFVWQNIAGVSYQLCEYKFAVDYRRLEFSSDRSENLVTCSVARSF